MLLSPSGRSAVKHRVKNPGRVERGKASAEERIARGWNPKIRSTHLGYDCYATGAINGSGKIRIVLAQRRLPPHLPADVVALLPSEMWWPERDHDAAHALIDAVLAREVGKLRLFKTSFPTHEFGFERFLEYADRRAAAVRDEQAVPSPRQAVNPDLPADHGQRLPSQLSRFPSPVDHAEALYQVPYPGYEGRARIEIDMVTCEDASKAMSIAVWGQLVDGRRLLCSRAFVDPASGEFEIMVHRPARYEGLQLPVTMLHSLLGIRRSTKAVERTSVMPTGRPKDMSSANESAAMYTARHVDAVLAVGRPTAERALEAVVADPDRPDPELEPGGHFEPEVFPTAPGGPGISPR